MITVLNKKTNELIGFDESTSSDEISQAMRGYNYGEVSTHSPTFYEKTFQPVLEKMGMDIAQPKFVFTRPEPSALRAFSTSAVREASFGILQDRGSMQKFTADEQAQHPVASFLGGLTGQTGAIVASAGIGGLIRLPAIGAWVASKVGQAGIQYMAKAAPTLTKAEAIAPSIEAASRIVGGAVTQGGVGAIYGGIRESVTQMNEEHPEWSKVGEAVFKDTGAFAIFGGVGAGIVSKPVGAATIAGVGYGLAKADGATEEDALLNGAVMGIFHSISATDTPEARKKIVDGVEDLLWGYLKAKNKVMANAVAGKTANEFKMIVADEVVKEINKEGTTIEIGKAEPVSPIEQIVASRENTEAFVNKVAEKVLDVKTEETKSSLNNNDVNIKKSSEIYDAEDLANYLGSLEPGGTLRFSDYEDGPSRVIGRDASARPEFYQRITAGLGVGMEYTQNAFKKFVSGEKLTEKQRRLVDLMMESARKEIPTFFRMAKEARDFDSRVKQAKEYGFTDDEAIEFARMEEINDRMITELESVDADILAWEANNAGQSTRSEIDGVRSFVNSQEGIAGGADVLGKKEVTLQRENIENERKSAEPAKYPSAELKNSRAFERAKEKYSAELEGEASAQYTPIQIVDQMAKAFEFIDKQPSSAKRVARGLEVAPEGLTETAVSIAYAEKMLESWNIGEFINATRSRSLRQTERGQEIVMERAAGTNVNDPIHFIKQVLDVRMEIAGKNLFDTKVSVKEKATKTKTMEKIKSEVKKLKKEVVDQKQLDIAEAQAIIDSLGCKR